MNLNEISELIVKTIRCNKMFFMVSGKRFGIVYLPEYKTLTVQAEKKDVTLFAGDNLEDKQAILECVEDIAARISEHLDGCVRCCKCNKLMQMNEAGGKKWSAFYCKDCWTDKINQG